MVLMIRGHLKLLTSRHPGAASRGARNDDGKAAVRGDAAPLYAPSLCHLTRVAFTSEWMPKGAA